MSLKSLKLRSYTSCCSFLNFLSFSKSDSLPVMDKDIIDISFDKGGERNLNNTKEEETIAIRKKINITESRGKMGERETTLGRGTKGRERASVGGRESVSGEKEGVEEEMSAANE